VLRVERHGLHFALAGVDEPDGTSIRGGQVPQVCAVPAEAGSVVATASVFPPGLNATVSGMYPPAARGAMTVKGFGFSRADEVADGVAEGRQGHVCAAGGLGADCRSGPA
jgi:hypothetical protein